MVMTLKLRRPSDRRAQRSIVTREPLTDQKVDIKCDRTELQGRVSVETAEIITGYHRTDLVQRESGNY